MTAKITQELITENYNRIPSQTLTLYVLMAIVLVSFCLAKIDNFAEPSLVLSFTLELQNYKRITILIENIKLEGRS